MSLSGRRANVFWFSAFLGCLAAVYSTTLIYPYLLADETWIVRPTTPTWGFIMGRPLFSIMSWIVAKISVAWDFNLGIYILRLSGILGLALAGRYLMLWLECWGHRHIAAFALALAAMTLPAYQMIVDDGTQLATAIFLTIAATYYGYRHRQSWTAFVASAVLLCLSMLIYQQQILIVFALLTVPLLAGRSDFDARRFVVVFSAWVAVISITYFASWKIFYRFYWPGHVDKRYGPDAVGLPSLGTLHEFFTIRAGQVGDLWDVDQPSLGPVIIFVLILMALKLVTDVRTSRQDAAINYMMIAFLFVASDGFRLVAGAYPSYVTATALSFLVFYWAYRGLIVCFRKESAAAGAVAVMGCCVAAYTTRFDIALPNWRESCAISQAIVDHPGDTNFRLNGRTEMPPEFQEFGWRNSLTDFYLYEMALDIADHLDQLKKLPQGRSNVNFSVAEVFNWATPDTTPSKMAQGSVIVDVGHPDVGALD